MVYRSCTSSRMSLQGITAFSLMFIKNAPASLRCRLYASRGGGVNLARQTRCMVK